MSGGAPPDTLSPALTLLGHESWTLRCALSGDGTTALCGDGSPAALLWRLSAPGTPTPLGGARTAVRQAGLTYDGGLVALAADGRPAALLDTSSGATVFSLAPPPGLFAAGAAVTPDGRVFAATFRSTRRARGALRVARWRALSLTVAEVARPYALWQVSLSADGGRAAFRFWRGARNGVELVDPWAGDARALESWAGFVGEWAFALDGAAHRVAVADERALRVHAVGDRAATRCMPGYAFGSFAAAALSADGKRVAAPVAGDAFRVWCAASGAPVAILVGHAARTNAVALSADGTRAVTCAADRTARVWDVRGDAGVAGGALRDALRRVLAGERAASAQYAAEALAEPAVRGAADLLHGTALLALAGRAGASAEALAAPAQALWAAAAGRLHTRADVHAAQLLLAHAARLRLLPKAEAAGVPAPRALAPGSQRRVAALVAGAWRAARPPGAELDAALHAQLRGLREALRGERGGLHARAAACALFLAPETGSWGGALPDGKGDAATVEQLLDPSPSGVAAVERFVLFDPSDLRVLCHRLAPAALAAMPPRQRRMVDAAFAGSGFEGTEDARDALAIAAAREQQGRSPGAWREEAGTMPSADHADPALALSTLRTPPVPFAVDEAPEPTHSPMEATEPGLEVHASAAVEHARRDPLEHGAEHTPSVIPRVGLSVRRLDAQPTPSTRDITTGRGASASADLELRGKAGRAHLASATSPEVSPGPAALARVLESREMRARLPVAEVVGLPNDGGRGPRLSQLQLMEIGRQVVDSRNTSRALDGAELSQAALMEISRQVRESGFLDVEGGSGQAELERERRRLQRRRRRLYVIAASVACLAVIAVLLAFTVLRLR